MPDTMWNWKNGKQETEAGDLMSLWQNACLTPLHCQWWEAIKPGYLFAWLPRLATLFFPFIFLIQQDYIGWESPPQSYPRCVCHPLPQEGIPQPAMFLLSLTLYAWKACKLCICLMGLCSTTLRDKGNEWHQAYRDWAIGRGTLIWVLLAPIPSQMPMVSGTILSHTSLLLGK